MSRSLWSESQARRQLHRNVIALLLAVALTTGGARAAERQDWYRAVQDHHDAALNVLVVTREDGSQWIRVLDVKLLGIPVPAVQPWQHAHEALVPLASVDAAFDLDPVGGTFYLTSPHPPAAPDGDDLVLDITTNGEPLAEAQIVRNVGGTLWLSSDTLAAARLVAPAGSMREGWVRLDAIAGQRYVLDVARMQLDLTAEVDQFRSTSVHIRHAAGGTSTALDLAPLAVIVGYDALIHQGGGARTSSLLLDTAVSKGRVDCRSRQLLRSSATSARLDSRCEIVWPERQLSLVVGDATSRESAISAPVRYGGIRIGTDFGLQPQQPTQPMLGLSGSARMPSVLEVWVQQQLALHTDVQPGPFTIDGFGPQSGRGDISAVLTDALGRRTVVNEPFYSDPHLLQPGLTDWSLEAGRLRDGFLLADDHYGNAFALLSWRRGIRPDWTIGTRAEWTTTHRMLEVASDVVLGYSGVVELSLARSIGRLGTANAYAAGYRYQGQRWNLGIRYETQGAGFSDLAYPVPLNARRRNAQFNAGVRIGRASLFAGALLQDHVGTAGRQRIVRAGLSSAVGNGSLNVTAIRLLDGHMGTTYLAVFTLPLGVRHSLSTWIDDSDAGLHPGMTLQRNAPAGPGYGYTVSVEDAAAGLRSSFDARWRLSHGQLNAALFTSSQGIDGQLEASGAIVANGAGIFAAPDDGGSFAVVTLPQPDAHVLQEHQYASRTDAHGHALISNLRPFESNLLEIDPTTLNASTHLAASTLQLVPGRRNVLRTDFGASRRLPLTLQVTSGKGAIPPGAMARMGASDGVPMGYDGVLYLELEGAPLPITVHWGDKQCAIAAATIPSEPDPAMVYKVNCQ